MSDRLLAALVEELLGRDLALRAFRLVKSEGTKVRYESARVYLEFTHDPRDGDVGLYFGRLGLPERFQFLLYMSSVAPSHPSAKGDVVESTAEIEAELRAISDALRQYGQPILDGDDSVFDKMKSVRWWDFGLRDDPRT